VSFATITLCVVSQQVFIIVDFVIDSCWKLLDTPLYMKAVTSSNACQNVNIATV
jgi:hypothetical protein